MLPPPGLGAPAPSRLPVLLVHGIDDDHRCMIPLAKELTAGGWLQVKAIDLQPADGSVGIDALAQQVRLGAEDLRLQSGSPKLDVVAFSMGALVSRYWLQKLGGKAVVRRFVSLSGPHQGTWMAYSRRNAGGRQMRPGSELIRSLSQDPDPWGRMQVWAFWTPYDLTIMPPESGALPQARLATFPVLLHPWMLTDARVQQAVIGALASETAAERP